jgi:hypothetical protein
VCSTNWSQNNKQFEKNPTKNPINEANIIQPPKFLYIAPEIRKMYRLMPDLELSAQRISTESTLLVSILVLDRFPLIDPNRFPYCVRLPNVGTF